MVKAVYKEVTAALETDDNKVEKTADNDATPKRISEYLSVPANHQGHILSSTNIIHATAYTNHYQSSGYLKVSAPPPDFYLQSIA